MFTKAMVLLSLWFFPNYNPSAAGYFYCCSYTLVMTGQNVHLHGFERKKGLPLSLTDLTGLVFSTGLTLP